MKTGYVYKDPQKELTISQLGGVAETIVKASFIKGGSIPKKLGEYDSERKKFNLLIDNIHYVIRNSNIESERKTQLMNYLKQNKLPTLEEKI